MESNIDRLDTRSAMPARSGAFGGSEDVSPLLYRNRVDAFGTREQESTLIDHYFIGPTDTAHHSKLPFFIRVHGSVMPHMILPMLLVAVWSTIVWAVAEFGGSNQKPIPCLEQCNNPNAKVGHNFALKFDPILLTVTGFLVGLALSFRGTTGYERYIEGRKYWSQLTVTSHALARIIWTHSKEREGELGKEDLLAKITCLQLISAFAIALKHRLRFEPYIAYDDMREYVEYLDTFAKKANEGVDVSPRTYSKWKQFGEFLGLPFAESNPRKQIKRAKKPLGNLPLEILGHIQGYLDTVVDNGTLKTPVFSAPVVSGITALNDVLTGTERILNTPLPLAYRIVISQITWLYVLSLPLQLVGKLNNTLIPATLVTSYIILGLALIGSHIENPFGNDVNDLPLDKFCEEIAHDIDVIMSMPAHKPGNFVKRALNKPLWPLSRSGSVVWAARDEGQIREALYMKVNIRHDRNKRKTTKMSKDEMDKEAEV